MAKITQKLSWQMANMKKVLMVTIAFILCLSAFLVPTPHAKAENLPGSSEKGILIKQWSYGLAPRYWWGYFGSSPAIANLGPDVNTIGGEPNSDLEIVVGSDGYWFYSPELGYSVPGLWRAFDSQGNWEWARSTQSDESRSSPVIIDLDGDGNLEIAGGTTSGWHFQVMNRKGEFIWMFPKFTAYVGGPFIWPSSPAAADINPKVSGIELVIGNRYHGSIWAFKGIPNGINDGITITTADFPYFPYSLGTEGVDWDVLWVVKTGGEVWATPAIGDVDNDGTLEVIIGSTDRKLYIINGADGSVEATIPVGSSIYASAALANLDADPYLEIVISSTDGKVYCYQWNGVSDKTEWTFSTGAAIYSSASIGDIDGDGNLEIVVGSTDRRIYALSSSGSLKWNYLTGGAIYSSPALANRGAAGLGIYVGSNDSYLYLISGTGTLIDRFLTYGQIRTSPAVADIDGDEKLEIVFYDWSSYDTLWVLKDTGSNVSQYAIEWQMFRRDASRTGLYTESVLEWVKVKEDGECIYHDESLSLKLKCFPQGWILRVLNPERKSWEEMTQKFQIEDVTDGISGWIKKDFLNYDPKKQTEWEERTKKLDPSKNPGQGGTVPPILEAVNYYYHNVEGIPKNFTSFDKAFNEGKLEYGKSNDEIKYLQKILKIEIGEPIYPLETPATGYFGDITKAAVIEFQKRDNLDNKDGIVGEATKNKLNELLAIYRISESAFRSSNDRDNFLSLFKIIRFPLELILAIATQESGGVNFDNEIIGKPWGRGIMQIDWPDDYVGLGSGIRWYKEGSINYCRGDQLSCKHYYTNTSQGVWANIKDGLRVLQEKYKTKCPKESIYREGYEFSCRDIEKIITTWGYNGLIAGTGYLGKVADRLRNLKNYFPEVIYPNMDNLIEKLEIANKPENQQTILSYSPVEVQVIDSQERITGLVKGEIKEEIPNSGYDKDYKSIGILFPEDNYIYKVIGTEEGNYGLEIISGKNGEVITFTAVDIPIMSAEIHQYAIDWDLLLRNKKGVTLQIDADGDGIFDKTVIADNELTYDEFILQTETIIDFDPDVLNLKSEGNFVTVYIELPEGFDLNQIDISSIMLNDLVPALTKPTEIGDYDSDRILDLMVKFERNKVQAILNPGEKVSITITGRVFHNGNYLDFRGSDIIRVIK